MYWYFLGSVLKSSSEDSVSSLSVDVCSGFSYCNKRSKRKDRSRVHFNNLR